MTVNKFKPKKKKPRIVIPITPNCNIESLLRMADILSESDPVMLIGIVPVGKGKNLSKGAHVARELREKIQSVVDREKVFAKPRVRVTDNPWQALCDVIIKSKLKLLVLDKESQLEELKINAKNLMEKSPCSFAIIKGDFRRKIKNISIPVRASSRHSELVFRTGVKIADSCKAKVKTLYIKSGKEPFFGLEQVANEMKNVDHENITSKNLDKEVLKKKITNKVKNSDLIICGTTSNPTRSENSFGAITDEVFNRSKVPVIAINTSLNEIEESTQTSFDTRAISVLVDKWFAENTFHSDEFSNIKKLVDLKKERGLTISLALPALNEEKTIGNVIKVIQKELQKKYPLIDELVLIDSDSSDKTREIAKKLGVPVYIHQEILPKHGARKGKGEALWKSLYVTSGDIVLWVDTDISNFDARFVYGLIGPLLYRPNLQLIKAFYRRPLKSEKGLLQHNRGGRVTELTARPLLNLFYPELSGIIQPLSGEYGGRRKALEQLAFTSGYGVETSILIDSLTKFGLNSIAQTDMIERVHNNQSLRDLSKMSFEIIQTFVSKAEKKFGYELLKDVNRSMKMIKDNKDGYSLVIEELAEKQRPAMIKIPEYVKRHHKKTKSERKLAKKV